MQAQRLRRILTAKVDALFETCDVLLTAVIPGPAPVLEETDQRPWREPQPISSVFNVTSHPCIAQPCGFAANGLPLSVQFVGRAFDEAMVLRVGHAYEREAGWTAKRPANRDAGGVREFPWLQGTGSDHACQRGPKSQGFQLHREEIPGARNSDFTRAASSELICRCRDFGQRPRLSICAISSAVRRG